MMIADTPEQLAAGADRLASALLVPVWLVALVVLLPAIWRLLRGRGRYTDAIWGLSFLGISNRLTYLLHVAPLVAHTTALLAAVGVIGFATWYQINDAR